MNISALISEPVASVPAPAASSAGASQDDNAEAQFNGILSNLSGHSIEQEEDQEAPATNNGPGSAAAIQSGKSPNARNSGAAQVSGLTASAGKGPAASFLNLVQQAAGTAPAAAKTPGTTGSSASTLAAVNADVSAAATPSPQTNAGLQAALATGAITTSASQNSLAAKAFAAKQNQTASTAPGTPDPAALPQAAAYLASMLGLSQTTSAPASKTSSATASAGSSVTPAGVTSQAAAGLNGTADGVASLGAATGQSAGGQTGTGPGNDNLPGQGLAQQLAATAAGASSGGAEKGETSFSTHAAASDTSIIKSVSVETQFAPAGSLSPMLQVIDTVQKLAASEGTSAAADPTAVTVASSAGPSRSMTLVLEPENLGTVTVTMQMRGNNLDLQLDVADPQTLALLNKDRDSLTAAMTSQDYVAGSLTIRASDVQNSSAGTNDGAQNQSQSSSGQGAAQSQSNGGSNGSAFAGGGSSGGGNGGNAAQVASVDDDTALSSAASGVYI